MTSATANSSSNGERVQPHEKVSNDSRGLIALLCGMLLLGYIVLREMIGGGDLPPIETPIAETRAGAYQQPNEPAEPPPHALRPVGPGDGLLIPAPLPDARVEGDLASHEELLPLFAPTGEAETLAPATNLRPPNPLRIGRQPAETLWR